VDIIASRLAGRSARAALAALLLATTLVLPATAPGADPVAVAQAGPVIPIRPDARLPIVPYAALPEVHFVPNTFRFWDDPRFATTTDPPKPAYADVVLSPTGFLPARADPFALCYYSGPDGSPASEDLSCEVTPDGRFANCRCYEIPYGSYFVLNTAILNYPIYLETLEACARTAAAAARPTRHRSALHQRERLHPGADVISTFSFDCVPTDGLGSTSCSPPEAPPYAGCMTAPCERTDEEGIVECSCPLYDGPYQVGQSAVSCDLGDDLVWSAAYAADGPTFPQPPGCIPDAPARWVARSTRTRPRCRRVPTATRSARPTRARPTA